MAGILKVDKIRVTGSDSDSISFDGSGNITFNKTVTGDNAAMVKLLDTTVTDAASYILDNTYLNSTYDEYRLHVDLLPATDNTLLYHYAYYGDSSTKVTSTEHGIQAYSPDGGSVYTNTDIDIFYRPCRYNIGNAAGEGVRYEAIIQNVNSTTQPYCIHGHYNQGLTGGTHVGGIFYGSAQPAYRDRTLRGIQFIFNSGNIASGYIKLYGIK